MSKRHTTVQRQLLWLIFCVFILGGCSAQVSTAEIRQDLESGSYDNLGTALHVAYEKHPVMINALNLGRFYQLQGQWDDSTQYFGEARTMLEDYEQRAIVSARNVGGTIGTLTLSRASAENFGTGYERSLLHTFNGINYLMKNDFQAAAVEMRRMEQRQEMWLEETEYRLRERIEEEKKNQAKKSNGYGQENLPPGYTMSAILSDPTLRQVVSSYQDPFSYSLSAIICRLYGDMDYARVSLGRACQLDERAYQMFRTVWQQPLVDIAKEIASGKRWQPTVPPLPRKYREGASNNPATQEVTFIYFGGLSPAMKMEQIRIPEPNIGYIMIDLPSYEPEVPAKMPKLEVSGGEITAYPLLRTDLLAYRHLRDEIGYEMTAAITRAITRAAVSIGGQALASSNEDTEAYSPLIGLLLTFAMDAYASSDNDKVRNWELLPARGLLGMTNLPRGSSITLTFENNEYIVQLPIEARGIIVLVSQVENTNLKVDYVTY